jgi:hypothetical protein
VLSVLTAAKSTALLTRAAVKARLGISDPVTKHDETLDDLIAAASAAAVRVIVGAGPADAAKQLVATQYRALLPGSGRNRLVLPRRPVDPITLAVEIDETAQVLDEDYSVDSAAQGILFRAALWPRTAAYPGMEGEADIQADFWAGYVPPAVAAAWSNRTVAVGDWVLPTNLATSPLRFRCTVAGAMGSTEPTWSTYDAGDTVTAGAATLIAHQLPDAPADLLRGAYFAVETWFRSAPILAGVAADRIGPHEITYQKQADHFADALPRPTLALWEPLAW